MATLQNVEALTDPLWDSELRVFTTATGEVYVSVTDVLHAFGFNKNMSLRVDITSVREAIPEFTELAREANRASRPKYFIKLDVFEQLLRGGLGGWSAQDIQAGMHQIRSKLVAAPQQEPEDTSSSEPLPLVRADALLDLKQFIARNQVEREALAQYRASPEFQDACKAMLAQHVQRELPEVMRQVKRAVEEDLDDYRRAQRAKIDTELPGAFDDFIKKITH